MKISIYGEPGSGKTTLMIAFFQLLICEGYKPYLFTLGTFKGEVWNKEGMMPIYIPGVWDGSTFQGTDRLSMSVSVNAGLFLDKKPEGHLLIEGARLFTGSFLRKFDPDWVLILKAETKTLDKRYQDRNSAQSETWLKGRRTAIKTIEAEFSDRMHYFASEVEQDIINNANRLKSLLCTS